MYLNFKLWGTCEMAYVKVHFIHCTPDYTPQVVPLTPYGYKQREYRGEVSTTISGHTCLNWFTDFRHPYFTNYGTTIHQRYGIGAHNYCRNPSEARDWAWCYYYDSSPSCVDPIDVSACVLFE